jgi:hypothetical protein
MKVLLYKVKREPKSMLVKKENDCHNFSDVYVVTLYTLIELLISITLKAKYNKSLKFKLF